MIKEYNINDYLKDDKELQKAVIQELITENEKLKQALKEIEEIAYTTDFDIVDIQEIVDEVLK